MGNCSDEYGYGTAAPTKLQRFVQFLGVSVACLGIEKDVVDPLLVGVTKARRQQLSAYAEILGLRMDRQAHQLGRLLSGDDLIGMKVEYSVSNRSTIALCDFHTAAAVQTLQFGSAHVPKGIEGRRIHARQARQVRSLGEAQDRRLWHGLHPGGGSIVEPDRVVKRKAGLSQTGLEPALIGQDIE